MICEVFLDTGSDTELAVASLANCWQTEMNERHQSVSGRETVTNVCLSLLFQESVEDLSFGYLGKQQVFLGSSVKRGHFFSAWDFFTYLTEICK